MLSIAAGFRVDIKTRLTSKIRSTDAESVRQISFISPKCNLIKIFRKCLFLALRSRSPNHRIFSTTSFVFFFYDSGKVLEAFVVIFIRFYTVNTFYWAQRSGGRSSTSLLLPLLYNTNKTSFQNEQTFYSSSFTLIFLSPFLFRALNLMLFFLLSVLSKI